MWSTVILVDRSTLSVFTEVCNGLLGTPVLRLSNRSSLCIGRWNLSLNSRMGIHILPFVLWTQKSLTDLENDRYKEKNIKWCLYITNNTVDYFTDCKRHIIWATIIRNILEWSTYNIYIDGMDNLTVRWHLSME